MRIVVLSRFYWPDLGGAQSQLRMLARQWGSDGHDVRVLTCRWDEAWPAAEEVENHRIERWPVWRTRFVGTVRFAAQIDRWIARHHREMDVLMVSMLKHAAWVSTRACGRTNTPIFLKSWGAGNSGDMAWQEKGRFGSLIRRGTRAVDGIFSPSRAVTEELLRAGYERIISIPNGVPRLDPEWNPADCSRWRQKLGWPDRPTIVTTGRLSWEKGLMDAVSAMPTILEHVPEAQLVMVGEGPQRGELAAKVQSLELSDRVLMPGAVGDVTPSLRAGDLYLLPSHFEGLSVALLEALCLGMPASASDTPANLDILPMDLLPLFSVGSPEVQGETVGRRLCLPPSDLERVEIRRQACERFGIEAVARQHVQAFEQAVERRRSR